MHNDSSPRTSAKSDKLQASVSLDRRRALLSGLSKGGAALGAAGLPLLARGNDLGGLESPGPIPTVTESFPNYKTPSGVLCTVSGQQSAVMSRGANNYAECGGNGPGFFVEGSGTSAVRRNWPNLGDNSELVTFRQLYPGAGTTNATRYLLDILANAPTSDEAHWIAAYFNALLARQLGAGGPKFPFNTVELRQQYASNDPKYLLFLKTFNLA